MTKPCFVFDSGRQRPNFVASIVSTLLCVASCVLLVAPVARAATNPLPALRLTPRAGALVPGTMIRDYALHLLFWAPPGTTLASDIAPGMRTMESDIQTALATGHDDNIFSVPGQYQDSSGQGDPRIASIDATNDGDAVPANQTGTACQNAPPPCVTTTQLDQEVDAVAARGGWTPGRHTLVLMVLASPVVVCDATACEFGCSYHSLTAGGYPDAVITLSAALQGGCGLAPDLQYAEDLTGHEQNEAIVDPDGTGTEIADPCVGNFAPNEINGHEYEVPYLQLPSGVCSPVSVFKPTLNASFTVRAVPVKGGSSVTFFPAKNEDPGGDLIHDQWYELGPKPIEGAGRPITHVYTHPDPDAGYLVAHLIQDLSGASVQRNKEFKVTPTAQQVAKLLAKRLVPSGRAARIGEVLRHGKYSFAYAAPSPGRLVISWYLPQHAGKPLLVAKASAAFAAARKTTVNIRLLASGRKHLASAARLRLTAKASFTPTGASAIDAVRTITLRR